MKYKKLVLVTTLVNLGVAIPIVFINFLFFKNTVLFFPINFLSVLMVILPFLLFKYLEVSRVKSLEEMFTVFLRDLVEAVRGGLVLPQAFKRVSKNDYGPLTPYVKKMAARVDWGIPVEKILFNFSKETGSKLIGRVISSVIESHRAGGNLTDVLEALGNTAVEVERLRAERRLYLQSQVITGYIVFFVFLGVMIGLKKFLLPSLTELSVGAAPPAIKPTLIAKEYTGMFQNLIVIQGFFAGLIVGKMAEGQVWAGVKHSLIMMVIGIAAYLIFG